MSEFILECRGVSKSYKAPVLCDFNLSLKRGKIIGLLGPNGSGKTTLIKMFAGLLMPNAGEITVDGKKIGSETKAIVSYLPDRNSLPLRCTVGEIAYIFQTMFPDFDPARALALVEDLNINLNAKLSTLSKGNREKVQLIMVMSRRAKLYLLDEPIAGVDPATRDYILGTIIKNYDREATIVISTHLIADVENVLDEFIFLKNGVLLRYEDANEFKANEGITIDEAFRRDFRC